MMLRFILFGNPVAHSLSPQLHTAFAKQFNLSLHYETQCVTQETFADAVTVFRAQGGAGANITAPLKLLAFDYAEQHTARACASRSVNTFIFRNNICIGDNTDGVGLIRDLQKQQIRLQRKNIFIMGAGGTAHAILPEIINLHPKNIFIDNRTTNNAQKLIALFEKNFLIEMMTDTQKIDIVINTTTQDFTHYRSQPLKNTICYDVNYGVRHDTFLQWAIKNNAARILDGMGMLKEQAAESFFQWTGKRPISRQFQQN